MANPIVPFAKAVYLCDAVFGSERGKIDMYGVFNSVRPKQFPHVIPQFVILSQLSGGLGDVPFHFDIRRAEDDALIRCTERRLLPFPDRSIVHFVAMTVEECVFDRPGLYLVQLYCNNQWVADASLQMGERQ